MDLTNNDLLLALNWLISELRYCTLKVSLRDIETSFGSLGVQYSVEFGKRTNETVLYFKILNEGRPFLRGVLGFAALLFSSFGVLKDYRQSFIEKEKIDCIVTVNHHDYFGAQLTFIIFDRTGPTVKLAACENLDEVVKVLLNDASAKIQTCSSNELTYENFSPTFYSAEKRAITNAFQNTPTKPLNELAELISGKSALSSEYSDQGIAFLRARDIQDGRIYSPDVYLTPNTAEKFSRQLLQEGDILLTKFFSQRKLALVTQNDLPAIASNSFVIIRPFGVSEKYLFRYLTSKTGNAVFNDQLSVIEKGITIPSISIADLSKIEVPIYDEETMLTIEKLDEANEDNGIETAIKILNNIGKNNQDDTVELQVVADLAAAGWNVAQMKREALINPNCGKYRFADFEFILPDGSRAYFEIKQKIARVTNEWVNAIKDLLFGDNKCFYVLTTGLYYETHVTGSNQSLKTLHAPSPDELLKWERGLI